MESSRVIVVDDEPGYADLIGNRLERADGITVVTTVTDPDRVLEHLKERTQDVDCVVSDYDMPNRDGLELHAEVQEVAPDVDFILYTAYLDEELTREADKAGVSACFRKDGGRTHFQRLLETVRAASGEGRGEAEERGAG